MFNSTIYFCLVSLTLCFSASKIKAQQTELIGKITDPNGKPIPFASVWINTADHGTTANELGSFRISLTKGTYTCSFRSPGYIPKTDTVMIIGDKITYNVMLNRLQHASSPTDTANEIMRRVIANRNYYRRQIPPLTGKFYSKALQELNGGPKMFFEKDITKKLHLDTGRKGIISLSEYIAAFHTRSTDYIQENVGAGKMTVDSNAFNFNTATRLHIDLYNDIMPLPGISDHVFLSPIASNARAFYRYQITGQFADAGQQIVAIRFTPKHHNEFLMSGTLYIVLDQRILQAADLSISAEARMDFVDSIRIKQQFVKLNNPQWVCHATTFKFYGKLLGFKYSGYFLQQFEDFAVDTVFNPDPHNEVFHSSKENYHKDNRFWLENRPVALLPTEQHFYDLAELSQRHKKDKTISDSLQNTTNWFRFINYFFNGYTLHNYRNNSSITFPAPYNVVFYNTVEGWGFDLKEKYLKVYDNYHNLTVIPDVRYGFSDRVLNTNVFANYIYNPYSQSSVYGRIGTDFLDLNNKGTISPFINSLSTLFLGNNYIKLYRSKFILLGAQKEVSNGVLLNGQFEYAQRSALFNSTYGGFNQDSLKLTSNNPLDPYGNTLLFPPYRAFIFRGSATFTFDQEYDLIPAGKFILPNPYPRVRVNFRMGIPALGSNVNYEFLSVDVFQDRLSMDIYGYTSYFLSAGFFPNARDLYYPDYNQFRGGESFFFDATLGSFHFLNYYTYSTDRPYFEAHLEHNFTGILLSHVPLIEKLNLQEIIGGSFLTQGTLPDYKEVYIGLKRRVIRLDYGLAYGRYTPIKQGFRLSYNFP